MNDDDDEHVYSTDQSIDRLTNCHRVEIDATKRTELYDECFIFSSRLSITIEEWISD